MMTLLHGGGSPAKVKKDPDIMGAETQSVVVGCNNPHHDLRSELAHLEAFISQLNEESKQVFFSNFLVLKIVNVQG